MLLFHAELGCPGGFVGVDVFFHFGLPHYLPHLEGAWGQDLQPWPNSGKGETFDQIARWARLSSIRPNIFCEGATQFSITDPQKLLPRTKVALEAHALADLQLPVANGNPACYINGR